MISDPDAFECQIKQINLNHKVIGSFYNAKFEMLVYNKNAYRMSHSSANYRKTINGIGRIYKFYNNSNKLISIFEGEIKNAQPNGFGRVIDLKGNLIVGYFTNGKP